MGRQGQLRGSGEGVSALAQAVITPATDSGLNDRDVFLFTEKARNPRARQQQGQILLGLPPWLPKGIPLLSLPLVSPLHCAPVSVCPHDSPYDTGQTRVRAYPGNPIYPFT